MPIEALMLAAITLCAPQSAPQPKPTPPPNPDEAMKQAGPGETTPRGETPGTGAPVTGALGTGASEPGREASAADSLSTTLDKSRSGFQLFPSTPAKLMPYLEEVNLYGSDCLDKDALVSGDPLSAAAQAVKTALAEYGINYSFWQAYDFVAMSDVVKGKGNVLNYYNNLLYATWNIFQSDELSGTSGWLVIGANTGIGLGYNASRQSAQQNLGTLSFPVGSEYGEQVYLYELAWQQSFFDGKVVVTAGYLDQEYYMDLNTYANNAYNQLLNYEFINPATLPWVYQSMGLVVQYQPVDWFYCMWGSAANNTQPRQDPFGGLSADNWSNTLELGYIDPAFLGMGKGIYRALPFIATVDGNTGGGILFNMEQQLWKDSPLGVFARGGFGNRNVTIVQGAEASAAGGFVVAGKTDSPLFKSEHSYFAAGMYWLNAADNSLARQNEYGVELTYVLQLTETLALQPDLQFIFNPVNNTAADMGTMFTMQLTLTW